MDDLSATIGAILNDPQKMEQLRAVAQSLGMNPPASENAPPSPAQTPPQNGGFDPAALSSMLQGFQAMAGAAGGAQQQSAAPGAASQQAAGSGGINLGAITKISEIMNVYNQNDKNTDLLRSLKPHISTGRSSKVDDAIRLMQLIRVWPMVRDSGLLSSLGNLGGLSGLGNLFGGGGNR